MHATNPELPPPSRATVAIGFVLGMLAGASVQGRHPAQLAAEVGIDAALLADPAARVPLAHYAALYNHVAATLDDETFGLFPQPMRVGSFEFLCRGVLSAATAYSWRPWGGASAADSPAANARSHREISASATSPP